MKANRHERQADEIERLSRLFCRWCGQCMDEHRVYLGVVGPFCAAPCRDAYERTP